MELNNALTLAIAYTAQFHYPLRFEEVVARVPFVTTTPARARQALNELVTSRVLSSHDIQGTTFYTLGYRSVKKEYERRQLSEKQAAQKVQYLHDLAGFLASIPWVVGVAITGSVAMKQATPDDDVDFVVITKPGSLWLVRPLVVGYAWLKGKRRTWQKEEGNSWCFNLWLESDQLSVSNERRTLYTAYEVCQTVWVVKKAEIEKRFFVQNRWVSRFLPQYYNNRLAQAEKQSLGLVPLSLAVSSLKSKKASATEKPVGPLTRWMNELLFRLQKLYMSSHMTREEVRREFAFFHPRNTKRWIYRRVNDMMILTKLHLQFAQRRVVLVSGVFDLLHQEHRRFLQKAKVFAVEHEAALVVGLESDVRVRYIKGEGRPIHPEQQRLAQVEKLGVADEVVLLSEDFGSSEVRQEFLEVLKPEYLAISSHSPHQSKKQAMMEAIGGELVVVHEHNPAISTTQLLQS